MPSSRKIERSIPKSPTLPDSSILRPSHKRSIVYRKVDYRVSSRGLGRGQIDVTQNEQDGKNPNQNVDVANLAGGNLDHGVRNQSQAQAGGDAEGERRSQHGDEGGDGLAEICPIDVSDRLRHESAHENEGGSGGVAGNRGREGGTEHG